MKGLMKTQLLKKTLSVAVSSIFITSVFFSNSVCAFTDMQGKDVSFKDYKKPGKWLVVEVWQSSCKPCKYTSKEMSAFSKEYQHIDVLGVSVNGRGDDGQRIESAKKFLQRNDVNFTNIMSDPLQFQFFYLDESDKSFKGTPSYMIYKPNGELAAVKSGPMRPDSVLALIGKHDELPSSSTANTSNESHVSATAKEATVETKKKAETTSDDHLIVDLEDPSIWDF